MCVLYHWRSYSSSMTCVALCMKFVRCHFLCLDGGSLVSAVICFHDCSGFPQSLLLPILFLFLTPISHVLLVASVSFSPFVSIMLSACSNFFDFPPLVNTLTPSFWGPIRSCVVSSGYPITASPGYRCHVPWCSPVPSCD